MFVIVDEVDFILIDEVRIFLIILGFVDRRMENYNKVDEVVKSM